MRKHTRPVYAAYASLPCDDATRSEAWTFARGVAGWAKREVLEHPMFEHRNGMKDVQVGASDSESGVIVHFWSFKEERLTECNALAAASEMAYKAGVLPTMAVYTATKYVARLVARFPQAIDLRSAGKCHQCKHEAMLSYRFADWHVTEKDEVCGYFCGVCAWGNGGSREREVANV